MVCAGDWQRSKDGLATKSWVVRELGVISKNISETGVS